LGGERRGEVEGIEQVVVLLVQFRGDLYARKEGGENGRRIAREEGGRETVSSLFPSSFSSPCERSTYLRHHGSSSDVQIGVNLDFKCSLLVLSTIDSVPDHGSYETSEEEKAGTDESLPFASTKHPWGDERFSRCFLGSASFDGSVIEIQS